jgi:hypothetical protein
MERRYKTNKKIYPELQMTPDAYPLMLELFEACKNRLRKLPFAEIQRQRFRIAFSYFGSWLIVRLYQGDLRRNELHLAICLDEPNPSPDAVIGGFECLSIGGINMPTYFAYSRCLQFAQTGLIL